MSRRSASISVALLSVIVLVSALAFSPVAAFGQSEPDQACRDWYEQSPPDEQAREELESQSGSDQDKDGCTGMFAAPGSQGPVEGAPEDPTNDPEGQKEFEQGLEEEASKPKDCGEWYANDTEEEQQREQHEDVARKDDLDGDGCIGEQPVPKEDQAPTKTSEECAGQLRSDGAEERAREMEEDAQFGVDNDRDGCIGDKETGEALSPGGAPATTDVGNDPTDDPGGFEGLALGAFQAILEWLYGAAVEKPSEEISHDITEEAFQMPDMSEKGVGAFYQKVADLVKPGAVVAMLYLGYLMMYQGASYNANVAAQNALPKLFIFFSMIGFLPDLLDMVSDLVSGMSKGFVSQASVETFISGQGSAAHSGAEQGFLAVIASAAAFVMMLLVLFICGIKNILFTQLYVLGPIPMLLWAIPGLSGIASAWARAMIACLALPLVFAAEFAIGALMINNPGSVFGEGFGNDSVFMSLMITAVVLYVVWRTPKHMLAWSVTGYSASPGIVSSVVKSVIVKRIR